MPDSALTPEQIKGLLLEAQVPIQELYQKLTPAEMQSFLKLSLNDEAVAKALGGVRGAPLVPPVGKLAQMGSLVKGAMAKGAKPIMGTPPPVQPPPVPPRMSTPTGAPAGPTIPAKPVTPVTPWSTMQTGKTSTTRFGSPSQPVPELPPPTPMPTPRPVPKRLAPTKTKPVAAPKPAPKRRRLVTTPKKGGR